MNNLYPLLLNLKDQLNQEKIIQEVKEAYQELKGQKTLIEKIKKYHQTEQEELRQELIQNPIIRKVKEKEGNLNYLILEINQNLEKIEKKKREKHESN